MTEESNQNLLSELITLAYRYKSDLMHPVTDTGSLSRRLDAINNVLEKIGEQRENSGLRAALIDCKEFLKGGEQRVHGQNPEDDDLYFGFYETDIDAQIEQIDLALKGE